MIRLFTLLAAVTLAASQAFATPISLDDNGEARLEAGDRAPVLVWLAAPETPLARDGGLPREDIEPELREMTNQVMLRTFGIPSARLATVTPEENLPRIAREFRYTSLVAMELTREEMELLAQDPGVRRIEADTLSHPYLAQSVPLIGASALHNGGNTGAGAGVAILDTGVDHEHPMFTGRITGSACFSRTSGNSTSVCPGGATSDTTTPGAGDNCEDLADDAVNGADGCFHGTHVAGIAVGGSFADPDNQGTTLLGVAPGADIIAVQVFSRFQDNNACGGSDPCMLSYTSDQLAALEWLFANRQALNLASINMSLGGGREETACPNNGRAPIITQLRGAGVATVIASGNDGFNDSVGAPACIPDAITVGSTTKSDTLSSFSNSNGLVDMVAPGSGIRSANTTANDSGVGRARTASGTSMATPHVAGAIALLRASHPNASVDAIENALEATGVPVTRTANNVTSPRIRVDLADAQLNVGGNGTIAGVMTVSPLQAFNAAGSGTNGADYGTQDYTLTNTSGAAINWQASANVDWLTLQTVASDGTPVAADTENGNLAAGANVIVRVGVNPSGVTPGNHLGTITFTVNGQNPGLQVAASLFIGATAPPNDNFANALPLTQISQQIEATTIRASKEIGEPNHVSSGGASVWWQWTPPASGPARISIPAASFDTMLAVYTGTQLGSLTPVASNDDSGGTLRSQVDFAATAGTTYMIALDGFNGANGTATLDIQITGAPANDNLANAMMLTGANGAVVVTNHNATLETGEPQHGTGAGGASIWFSWRAPADGSVRFATLSNGVADLAVYADSPFAGSALIQGRNIVAFNATNGTLYTIALDGPGGDTGTFHLSWLMESVPGHLVRAAMLPNARSITVGNTATAFATLINPSSFNTTLTNCRIEGPADFNGGFAFRRTDPATNQPIGNDGDLVDLAPGASQSYVVSVTPGQTYNGRVISPVYGCENGRTASPVLGVTTMTLTAAAEATADVISIASTPTANGILAIPTGNARAFSVAAVNIGAGQTVTVTPGTGGIPIPALTVLEICETNPATGQCISARGASVNVNFANNETRTFTVFVRANAAVDFIPAQNRVVITFTNGANTTVGATSVAVRSP
ncbi:S8 family serine peptidase [Hyphobacterium sp.]|uniref:S8 family serine peptidase n=1 Tax=Hyphobacterium sp. TaxID=2004662 RepID=UPI003BAB30A3